MGCVIVGGDGLDDQNKKLGTERDFSDGLPDKRHKIKQNFLLFRLQVAASVQ